MCGHASLVELVSIDETIEMVVIRGRGDVVPMGAVKQICALAVALAYDDMREYSCGVAFSWRGGCRFGRS